MSSIDVTISAINVAASTIIFVLSCVNFVLGAIGLILNVLVFTRPTLRREPSSLYFLSSTCFNLFVVFVIMPLRLVSNVYSIDLANYNLGICKIESFAFYSVRTISCWLIVLACVDRYLHSSSSIRIRRISSLKTARLSIGIISVIITILFSHMIVYYEINNASNQFGNIVPACNAQKGIYRNFIAVWFMILYSLCPFILMLLFGCLTMNNLRQRRQALPRARQTNQISRRTDTQLLRMLAAQVLVVAISLVPFCIYGLYTSFTANLDKDTLRLAQENLAFQIVSVMTYFSHSSSFYLYTLSGTIFRKELFKIIDLCRHPNRNRVHIIHGEMHQMSIMRGNRQISVTRNAPIKQ